VRARSVAAGALGALGGALLLAGLLVAYAQVAVVDARGFAARAELARQSPAVRAWLAQKVAVKIEQNAAPDLIAARPLIESVVASALGSDAVRPVYAAAMTGLHRDLLSAGPSGVVVNLTDAGVVVIGLLRARDPKLAAKIPLKFDAALIQVGELEVPARLTAAVASVRGVGPVLPFVALLFLGLSVALADDRWRALVRAAFTVAAIGLVTALAVMVAGSLLVDQVSPGEGERARAALQAVWEAFLGDLRRWGLVLATAGLVVAGAAIGAVSEHDLRGLVARAGRRLAAVPEQRAVRLARAVVIALVGLAAVLRPGLVLSWLAMMTGALLLVGAATELVLVVAPPGRALAPSRARAIAAWSLGGLAALALAALALPRIFRAETRLAAPRSMPGACNGAAALCGRRLDEVTFAGTHNSMSDASQGWFKPSQDGSILAQLEHGVRAFLIDVWWGNREGDHVRTDLSPIFANVDQLDAIAGADAVKAAERVAGRLSFAPLARRQLYLCHTLCELGATPFVDELNRMAAWLDAHPTEVVLLFVQDEVPPRALAEGFEQSKLAGHIYRGPLGVTLPTLGELVAAGTPVIVLNESGAVTVPWIHDGFAIFQDTPWQNPTLEDFRCDLSRGRPDSPMLLMNHWVSRQPPSVVEARRANEHDFLLARARKCEAQRGRRVNLIAVDFFREGSLREVVRELNGLPPQ
jgi:hypothetical protein